MASTILIRRKERGYGLDKKCRRMLFIESHPNMGTLCSCTRYRFNHLKAVPFYSLLQHDSTFFPSLLFPSTGKVIQVVTVPLSSTWELPFYEQSDNPKLFILVLFFVLSFFSEALCSFYDVAIECSDFLKRHA